MNFSINYLGLFHKWGHDVDLKLKQANSRSIIEDSVDGDM